MSALLVAVLLSLVSAVCYAGAAILQERVAARAPSGGTWAALRRAGWWGAAALTGLGAALHVVALACGPLSLVQPLGALTIVFALPMAALLVHRPVGAAGWRGALLATAGLAGLLSLTGPPHTDSLPAAQRPVLAGAALAATAVLALAGRWVRRPVVRAVALAGAAGAAFGMASVFTKAVAEDFAARGADPAVLAPGLAVTALLACTGMLLSQASYRGAGLAAPLATVTVVNPVVAAVVGLAACGEEFRLGVPGAVLAALAGAAAAAGVVLLTLHDADRRAPQPGPVPAAAPPPAPAVPGARRHERLLVSTRPGRPGL
ncbi:MULTISPECIES: DMT family transporter [Streptomyces]|uniref:Integral membrane protein n=1 Tax=Streptomyces luteosporeus TaxID=173856 RepID=A0ABN3TVA2_9ACTN